MAVLLLQESPARCHGVPGARLLHPADEAQKHPALDDGRRADHAPRPGVLPGGIGSWRKIVGKWWLVYATTCLPGSRSARIHTRFLICSHGKDVGHNQN